MLISFIVTGGINNTVARLGSMYNFRWSYSLCMVMLLRLIQAAFTVIFITAVLMTALCYAITRNVAVTSLMGPYFFVFSMMLVVYATLFTIHTKSVWKSPEGIAIVVSQVIPLVILCVLFFAVGISRDIGMCSYNPI